jgi:5'-nucleotidase
MPNKMMILLTNDDGYFAPGIAALRKALSQIARVVTVAPDRDRSGASHSLTVTRPLRLKKLEPDYYIIDGTPTDAVMVSVNYLLKRRPDLVISGINSGANMGEDVTYSGTVAAAIEGTLFGIPSIAVSLTGNGHDDFSKAAIFTRRMAKKVAQQGLPEGVLLNINVPDDPKTDIKNYAITHLGKRVYEDIITEKIDPRGNLYLWIAGKMRVTGKGPNTDYGAVEKKIISITPLRIDTTAKDFLSDLSKWRL